MVVTRRQLQEGGATPTSSTSSSKKNSNKSDKVCRRENVWNDWQREWYAGVFRKTLAWKAVFLAGLLAAVAACAQQEEEYVVVEPEPISVEPVHTGKYK